jgi:hypothetical protein
VDLIFAIKPQTSVDADLSAFISKIYNDFDRIKGAITDTEIPNAPVGNFTRDNLREYVTKEKSRIVDAFAYAFMVNMLPAEVRTKVLEQKPETISDVFWVTADTRKRIKDERRPLIPGNGPQLNVSSVNQESEFENLVSAVSRRLAPKPAGGNSGNNQQGNNQKKKKKQNNQSGQLMKCNYCHKTGHSKVDCFKRKEDKAPCYTAKGEAFFPEGEQGTKVNQEVESESGKGSDFRTWV